MGVFQNLFGKGKNRCGACGRSVDSSAPAMQIHALDPSNWDLSGTSGHCYGCNMELCDKHWEFQKEQPDGMYLVCCKRCNTPLGQRPIDPDIKRINFINIKVD